MEENKPKDKLKKLKNKKKDVISINPLEMLGKNPLKNNFKDKTKEEIKKEKKLIEENKINSQPLSSNQIFYKKNKNDIKTNCPYILPDDKKNISLIKNIVTKFENLFSYNDIVEERIVKLVSPLLTVDNYNSIYAEIFYVVKKLKRKYQKVYSVMIKLQINMIPNISAMYSVQKIV